MPSIIKTLHVHAISPSSSRGTLVVGNLAVPCVLGRAGIRALKREGDGATPFGRWQFLELFWRRDRSPAPGGSLAKRQMRRDMGWCDDPQDRNYNRPVRLPYRASHEVLWRDDGVYDIVMTLSHNVRPRRAFGGSAVFFHLATESLGPTVGCVAIRRRDAFRVLNWIGPRTKLVIEPGHFRPKSNRNLRAAERSVN